MKFLNSVNLRGKLLAAFAVVVVITGSVAGFSLKTTMDRTDTIGWIDHTNRVMMTSDVALMGLINMETGFRGFMATGHPELLEPYIQGQSQVEDNLSYLKELTSDNPAQVQRWGQIESAYQQWMREWTEPGMELREQANEASMSATHLDDIIAEGRGKTAMDSMRSQLAQLESNLSSAGDLESLILNAKLTESIVNQETGMRGFVVTGEEVFLEPYDGGQRDFTALASSLRDRLAGDAASLALLDDIIDAAAIWRAEAAEPWITARRDMNLHPITVEDVSAYVATTGGKQFMDAMRAQLAEARGIEEALLSDRQAADVTVSNLSQNVIVWGNLLAISVALIIAYRLSKTIVNAVSQMSAAAKGLAVGDLDQSIEVNRKDELGDMADSFREMVTYIRSMAKAAGSLADGDLTTTVEPRSNKDALGNAFAAMITNLRRLIGEVSGNASNVGVASGQLASSAVGASDATQQISATMQQISIGIQQQSDSVGQTASSVREVSQAVDSVAKGAQEQSSDLQKTKEFMEQLAASIQSISEGARSQSEAVEGAFLAKNDFDEELAQIIERNKTVSEFVENNLQTAKSGKQTVQQAVTEIDQLGTATEQLAGRIQELGRRSSAIGVIVETIDELAYMTNLLALNAAVEAARAGDHGKGFAVVAAEVQSLAGKSAESAQEISKMIRAVQSEAGHVVDSMSEAQKNVQSGISRTREAGQAFEEITEGTAGLTEQVEATSQAVTAIEASASRLHESLNTMSSVTSANQTAAMGMRNLSNQVLASVEHVSAVVEENTASTEEMSASAMGVSDAIESIAAVSEENGAAVEEVSAASAEMEAQVKEVSSAANSLRLLSNDLQSKVSRFKLPSDIVNSKLANPPESSRRASAANEESASWTLGSSLSDQSVIREVH